MQNGKHVILAVLAHPDDESFGMGGTLALYAERGAEVHLLCATRGESGDVDERYLRGFASVAERREAELRCAAEKLKLTSVHFMDYRDSGMPGTPQNQHPRALINAPIEEVAAHIATVIRQLRPQVVLTFDPIGGYRHPDHIAIHRATVRAFELANETDFSSDLPPYQPAKLYFHVIPKNYLRLAVKLLPLFGRDPHRYGRNQDIDLASLAKEGDFPIHAMIDYRPVLERKEAASICHSSQLDGGSLRSGPLHWTRLFLGNKDRFMRAYPPPEAGLRERDLLAGL